MSLVKNLNFFFTLNLIFLYKILSVFVSEVGSGSINTPTYKVQILFVFYASNNHHYSYFLSWVSARMVHFVGLIWHLLFFLEFFLTIWAHYFIVSLKIKSAKFAKQKSIQLPIELVIYILVLFGTMVTQIFYRHIFPSRIARTYITIRTD